MSGISALVLTYNRKELLAQCLAAIATQSEPPDEVVVLDNGSTDGTAAYLCGSGQVDGPRLLVYSLRENIGPAAGFDLLFRIAYARGADWLWCMDDDVIPSRDTLKELKAAFSANFSRPEEVGFLVSAAVDGDGNPSNVPEVDLRADARQCPRWADRLETGLVRIRWGTLNSALIPRTTLLRVGGLSRDFYFAGEDIDFTLRAAEILPGYLVGKSKVRHLRAAGGVFSALTQTDPERIRMALYYYRNNVYLRRRYYSRFRMVAFLAKCGSEALLALTARTHRLSRAASIVGGALVGLWFRPHYDPLDAQPTGLLPFDPGTPAGTAENSGTIR